MQVFINQQDLLFYTHFLPFLMQIVHDYMVFVFMGKTRLHRFNIDVKLKKEFQAKLQQKLSIVKDLYYHIVKHFGSKRPWQFGY